MSAETRCTIPGCSQFGEEREGANGSLVLCENHAVLVNFTDERLARWIRVVVLLRARFRPHEELAIGGERFFRVTQADAGDDLTVHFHNVGTQVSFQDSRPILAFRVFHERFGLVAGEVGPEEAPRFDPIPIQATQMPNIVGILNFPATVITFRELIGVPPPAR